VLNFAVFLTNPPVSKENDGICSMNKKDAFQTTREVVERSQQMSADLLSPVV
jgi:hypothetical protein